MANNGLLEKILLKSCDYSATKKGLAAFYSSNIALIAYSIACSCPYFLIGNAALMGIWSLSHAYSSNYYSKKHQSK